MHEPSGDLERVREALRRQWDVTGVAIDVSILRTMQAGSPQGRLVSDSAVHNDGRGQPMNCRNVARLLRKRGFRPAVDLGSTTIAAHLCSLNDGRVAGFLGDHESADPIWRRFDEPGLIRDAQRRRKRRNDPRCRRRFGAFVAAIAAIPESGQSRSWRLFLSATGHAPSAAGH